MILIKGVIVSDNNIVDIMKAIGPDKLREIAGLIENEQYTDISNTELEYAPPTNVSEVQVTVHNPVVETAPEQQNIPLACVRSGKYSVKWIVPDGQIGVLSMRDKIHLDTPFLHTDHPYVGPLCEHELEFFKGQPGFDYSAYWRFEVKERKGKK